jgi:hypothetical protein
MLISLLVEVQVSCVLDNRHRDDILPLRRSLLIVLIRCEFNVARGALILFIEARLIVMSTILRCPTQFLRFLLLHLLLFDLECLKLVTLPQTQIFLQRLLLRSNLVLHYVP